MTVRALILGLALSAGLTSASAAAPPPPAPGWASAWGAAQQIPEPRNALAADDLRDATLRQTVRLTRGGERLRVRLSNAFGTEPLRLDAVRVALAPQAGGLAVTPGSDRALTFGGRTEVVIPAGADYLSDPADLPVPAFATLAISAHFTAPPGQQTSHPGSRTTSFLAHGDQTAAADLSGATPVEHWFNLTGVEVETAAPRTIVALGDSITDGRGSTANQNNRWPDMLARHLQSQPATRGIGVVNVGIGGNRLLADGLGPSALARLDRDVLARPGARWVIVLEGINDIGTLGQDKPASAAQHEALVRRMTEAYEQIIARAQAQGLKVIGATLTPFGGSGYDQADPLAEQDRQAVNRWIRTGGRFDAIVDFDALVRDPAARTRLAPRYDIGDHLHPSAEGYRVMGEAIPLSLFR